MQSAGLNDSKIQIEIDSDDEFGESYEEPGQLTAEQVQGSVTYTVDWTIGSVIEQIDADPTDENTQGVIFTSPPFQRRTAWNDDRQSLYIESLMLGLPVPPLVLAESLVNPSHFYVLDGKQRLTALKAFVKGEPERLKLRGLELLGDRITGKTFDEIRLRPDNRKLVQTMYAQPVRTIVVRNWKSPALLHLIFSRLNKASVPLASHELRQALYPGQMTYFVNKESAESQALRRARRLKGADTRLRDAETLLRYIGFKTNLDKYKGDLRDFLDRVLKGGNDHYSEIDDDLRALLAQLEEAIDTTFKIFGRTAFLRYDAQLGKYMPRFNVAVFDLMTWYFSDPQVARLAAENPERVVAAFETLCRTNHRFSSYLISTTKTYDAAFGRIELWGKALGDVIGHQLDPQDFRLPFLPIAARKA
ncbi:DUF262 domain-containing protein [Streptomyces sp. NBC_01453]|uniref:DUF262 domain-containing protein n=1 Tax=Streptomyces sp. NBC_01453 TaxID=2903873 RepID=UPI002E2CFFA3|nr:DUF262 domain-containing protein [Streptomyces sp. NBC_01453]